MVQSGAGIKKIKGLVLEIEIEINLVLTLDGIASSDLHYQIVQA